MGLINLLLKAAILVLDLRDTYHALDAVKLDEIGRNERQVLVRNAQDGTKHLTARRRVGTSKRKAAVRSALTTVLVWNLFCKVEPLCDRTIAWFVPFYDSFKTLFLIWMLFTRSYGASILIFRLLAPIILRPYESIIDGIFDLTSSLFTWLAALLAPTVDKCSQLVHTIRSAIQQDAQSVTTHPASSVAASSSGGGKAPQRKASANSVGGKAGKRPPTPSSPPASIKVSPASAAASSAAVKSGPSAAAAKARQTLATKVSQSNLAATRRVLQELPVPRHAFDSVKSQASPSASASSSTSKADIAAPDLAVSGSGESATVKTEPSEPSLAAPAASLGPPPTPPTGLQNYAFIPGMTPQRSGPASLASPTPRFPGGFAFSAAASFSANPFQAPARVPLTTQMAPLSLSAQIAAPLGGHHLLGSHNGAPNNVLTHESVASAKDGRIVPPPNQAVGVRKVASQSSLKGKAAKRTLQNGDKAATVSNGKKRARSDEASSADTAEAGEPDSNSTSPRKRVKSVAGQVATSKKTAGSLSTARARAKKSTSMNGQTAAPGSSNGTHKREGANGSTSAAARKATVPAQSGSASTSTLANGSSTTSNAGSSDGKAKATATSSRTATAKSSTQRAAVRKAPSASKSRSQSTEVAESAEPPPQRLTRSRTKQNLAD